MSPHSSPTVTVTIVLYDSEPVLPSCLEAIRPELESGFAELVAVDNASPDDAVAVVDREAPKAEVVRADRNLGFAGGANLAWPHVRGRYWMLLNPDAIVAPGGLRKLAAWMDEHRDLGIASPAIADPDGRNRRSAAHARPSATLVIAELFRLHKLLPHRLRARIFQGPYWTEGDNLDAGWVPGTAMIVRREAAELVGLLDDSYFLYGEDIDWCWRMRRAAWRIGYCSEVVVLHEESAASLRSYGQAGTFLRMARMELRAVRRARGDLRAWAYAAALVLALGVETVDPRRSEHARERSSAWFRAWRTAALHPRDESERSGALSGIRERVGTAIRRPRRWRWLEDLPKGGVGAEIGVFRGYLSPHLHDAGKPAEFHLIDCWWTRFGEKYPDWGEMTDFGRLRTRDAHQDAVTRMAGRTCSFHIGDDLEILPRFPDRYFDWVYLDSDHDYEHVRDVLVILKDKVKPTGIIVGDDWEEDPSHPNHGESVAVKEFCERYGWELGQVDPIFEQWTIKPV